MDAQSLTRLVERAREDAQFFHDLVFNPDGILDQIQDLDRDTRAGLASFSPEEFVAAMFDSGNCACTHASTVACSGITCQVTYGSTEERYAYRPINPTAVYSGQRQRASSCGPEFTCSCTSGTCGGTCGGSTCSVTCSGDSCGRTCDNSCGYTTNLAIAVGRFRNPT
jgi:hypothetical protein